MPKAKTPPISVFLDANIYLEFYAYSDEDLGFLSAIENSIADGKLKLFVPTQTRDEVLRRREDRLHETISEFQRTSASLTLPRFMAEMGEATAFVEKSKAANKARGVLVAKAQELAVAGHLAADYAMKMLFAAATTIDDSEALFNGAIRRKRSGNPPGKGDQVGDELSWECLLAGCPDGIDLHIVTKDGDYRSKLDTGSPKEFLREEWKSRKGSNLNLHKTIESLLKAVDVVIVIQSQKIKDKAVAVLAASDSFAKTHSAIDELTTYFELLTSEDAEVLYKALLGNNQISLIIFDDDVRHFYLRLLRRFPDTEYFDLVSEYVFHNSNLADLFLPD